MIFTVAIDGPAAAGKGTIAKAVADHFGFAYLDTGLLYRGVAKKVLDGMEPIDAARALIPQDMERQGLRTAKVGQLASKVAAMPPVRAALIKFQQDFARREGGTVLDGRDIGTVICPDAEIKLYVVASDEVRAHRRWLELSERNPDLTEAEVLQELRARDARDTERATAPMKPAADALLLDTSDLTIEAAVKTAVEAIENRIGQGRA